MNPAPGTVASCASLLTATGSSLSISSSCWWGWSWGSCSVDAHTMADGDDLPDDDYESIYGHAALHARRLARLDVLIAREERMAAELHAMTEAERARHGPPRTP